jgi:predicted deacylase
MAILAFLSKVFKSRISRPGEKKKCKGNYLSLLYRYFMKTNPPLTLYGATIEAGEHALININVARLPSRTQIDTPVYVFRAVEKGSTLLLLAGMHGNETNGIEIVRQMIAKQLLFPKRGTVIAIPLLNVYGFLNLSRDVPDGKDINRSFPGSAEGSLASRLAHVVSKEILPHVDLGIDFHTGGGQINNYSQIRCMLGVGKNEEYARAFAPPFIIDAKVREKSLRAYAQSLGKPILVYEGGESMRLNRAPVKEGMRGTLRLMRHLGMIDEEGIRKMKKAENAPPSVVLTKTRWLRAKISGVFRAFVDSGIFVEKGHFIGSITDPFGEMHYDIPAPESGYIVAINHQPVVTQGDALFHIGNA